MGWENITLEEVKKILKDNGFEIVRVKIIYNEKAKLYHYALFAVKK